MANPTNKQELLETVRAEHGEWESVLNQVGAERMELRGVAGEWSVKDIVAHVTAWERRILAWLEAAHIGTWPQPPDWPTNLDEAGINAWIFELNRGRLLQDVLNESHEVFNQLMLRLERTPEQDFTDRNRFEWLRGSALLDAIPGNSSEHYQVHGEGIREWLAEREGDLQRGGVK